MGVTLVIFDYFKWHYSRALFEFTQIYKNLLKFVYNFFSIPLLIETFFSPWRRLGESYPKDLFKFEEVATAFVINSLMRLVGVFMRSIIIVFGFSVLLLMVILFPLLIIAWALLPLFSLFLFVTGLVLLIFVW